MLKSKKIKTLLFTLALSVVSMNSVQAATYTVTSGDSLYNIGKLFNINYTNIMKNNTQFQYFFESDHSLALFLVLLRDYF